MRTTVTLDPDVVAHLRKVMRERGLTFKEALNEAVRAAFSGKRDTPARTPEFAMGAPAVPLEHALRVAAELEDAELRRRLQLGT